MGKMKDIFREKVTHSDGKNTTKRPTKPPPPGHCTCCRTTELLDTSRQNGECVKTPLPARDTRMT